MQRSDLDSGKRLSMIRFRNLRERAIIGVNFKIKNKLRSRYSCYCEGMSDSSKEESV